LQPVSLHFISAEQLLQASVTLALQVVDSGFRPQVLLALWRGGTPVGAAMHEVFVFLGRPCRHAVISSQSYTAPGQQDEVELAGLERLSGLLQDQQRILLVDDVFDSGCTMQAVVNAVLDNSGPVAPTIRIATPWYKPASNRTALAPDYHLQVTEDWLVFPHELSGLADRDLAQKPGFGELLPQLLARRDRC
jgi:hypoxanthine phosphoribosyltransferase